MPLSSDQARWMGRKGGLVTASRGHGTMAGLRMNMALDEKFARQVDPDGVLPPEVRARRARQARRAWSVGNAYKREKRRAAKKG